ncbi:PDZ domain-containing protein [Flavobacterium sp. RSB2_4_14]|uniref:PDZ domain-containing protein n=1 Tax=Flavobacterium sp. RSB2_4_14 TaxID=3447665 RepID=UPI003F2E8EDA
MRIVFAFCLYFVTYLTCFSQSNFQIANDKKKIVIPFKLINNLIFIPINLNGESLTFLLDTGVEQTILFSLDDKEQVSLFHLEKINLNGLGSNDAIEAYKSSENKMEVNGYVDYAHVIYLVLDQEFNFSSQVGIPVNGIMGYHFFRNHPIEIDYERKKIIVYSTTNKKLSKKLKRNFKKDSISIEENKPYYISNVTTTNLNYPSKMLLDTGNSDAIWLFLNKPSLLQLPPKTIQDYLGRGFSGNVYGQRARIPSFTFGSKTFENGIGTFPDSTSVKSVNFVKDRAGSIGGEVLSRFQIVFDYPNGKLYSKPNSKSNEPFNFNMSGIEVQHDGLEWVKETYEDSQSKSSTVYNGYANDSRFQDNLKIKFELKPIFRIYNVRADSPAALAGLKTKDKIIAINKQKAHTLSIEKINELLKSEEGKTIEIEIERSSRVYTFKFQLKKIL